MHKTEAVVVNKLGLHARPSAKLTATAGRFQAEVWLSRGTRRVNAKSIMGVMMLAAACGSTVVVEAHGPDEEQAVQAIVELIADGFGEEPGN
jgi:phosphocarrier protein